MPKAFGSRAFWRAFYRKRIAAGKDAQLEAALAKKLTPEETAEAAARAERCLASDYRDCE